MWGFVFFRARNLFFCLGISGVEGLYVNVGFFLVNFEFLVSGRGWIFRIGVNELVFSVGGAGSEFFKSCV